MINVNQITAQMARMSDPALQQYAAMHKSDPYTLSLALSESNRRKEMRQGAQMQQPPQPKVVDQEIAQMGPQMPPRQGMQPQQLPEDSGIGQLPAPNMKGMAAGGIVAFDEGGEVPGYAGGGDTQAINYRQAIIDEAQRQGVPAAVALQISGVESGFNPNARPIDPKTGKPRSSATSFFQVIDKTFKDLGGDPDKRTDPMENIRIGVKSLAQNQAALTKTLGREPKPQELYTTHFLGTETGSKLLTADAAMPIGKFLASADPKNKDKIIAANPEVLGGKKTVGDVMAWSEQKMLPVIAGGAAQASTTAPQGGNGIDDLVQAAFGKYPSSGIQRQKGRLSEAITSGTGPGQMIEGATDLPYNLAGIPMDISHQVAKVFGSKTPNEKIFGTSAYLKNKATEAGIRKPETTDPTLAGFRTAGELGSLLVNPPGAGAGIPRLLTPETGRVIGATGKTKADQIIPDLNYKTAQQLDAARLTPAEIAELAKLRNAPPAVQPQSLLGYDAPQGLLTHGATPPPAAAPAAESGLPTLLKGDLVPPGPGASRQEILAFESNLRKQAQELKEAYPVATQADVAAMRAEGSAAPAAQQNYGQPPMRYTADEDRARKLATEKLAARPPATTAVTEASAVKPAITEANAVRTTATRPLVDAVGPSAAALKTGEGVASLLSNRPTTTELEPDWDMSKGLASLPDTKDLEKIGKEATPKSERKGMSGEDFLMIGLGIMSGQSPHAITNIGEGGLKGLQMVQASRKEASEAAAREMMAERYGIGAEVQLVNAMRDPTFAANYRTLVEAKNDPRQMQALAQEMLKTPGQMEMLKKLDPTLYSMLRSSVLGVLAPAPISSPGGGAAIRAPIQ